MKDWVASIEKLDDLSVQFTRPSPTARYATRLLLRRILGAASTDARNTSGRMSDRPDLQEPDLPPAPMHRPVPLAGVSTGNHVDT